jgi:hypothetical protein
MSALRLLNDSPEEDLLARAIADSNETDYGLKVAVIHHDEAMGALASMALGRAAHSVGVHSFHCAKWRIDSLLDSHVLVRAVQAAVAADVIAVSVRAQGEPPAGLCVWIDSWLPRRPRGNGALLAFIGFPGESPSASAQMQDYLRAVARRARLDFVAQQPTQLFLKPEPDANGTFVEEPSMGRAAFPFNEIRSAPLIQWGINE